MLKERFNTMVYVPVHSPLDDTLVHMLDGFEEEDAEERRLDTNMTMHYNYDAYTMVDFEDSTVSYTNGIAQQWWT